MEAKNQWHCAVLVAVMAIFVGSLSAAGPIPNYAADPTMEQFLRPPVDRAQPIGGIGVTGIEAHQEPGGMVVVDRAQSSTPADGKFKQGDVLLGVNGTALQGRNPLYVLGNALTCAEAKEGLLTFDVKAGTDGKTNQVNIRIPVLGAYGATFPLKCRKSAKIIEQAAQFYAGKNRLKAHTYYNGLACIFLLSTGEDRYVRRVKEYFSQFLTADGKVRVDVRGWSDNMIGDMTWDNGYNGIACAEYYLRTGDATVLPILQHYCDDAQRRMYWGLGWGHWGYEFNAQYETSGLINCAGGQVLVTLLLAKECGVNVDEKTLLGALKFWYRFAGRGAPPVSDHRTYAQDRSGGKLGPLTAAMQIASEADGDVAIYKEATRIASQDMLISWATMQWDWDVLWFGLASSLTHDLNPDLYYRNIQCLSWWYDLCRQPSGNFVPAALQMNERCDVTNSGVAYALIYTAPLKTLRITGAPSSKFAKAFTLPASLWGAKADRAFMATGNNPGYARYGKEEPFCVPCWQIGNPYGLLCSMPIDAMQRTVRHASYYLRAQAARALRRAGKYDELEALLRDPDPRLRRAGLDGIIDVGLHGGIGNDPLKTEQYTTGITRAITAILADTNEAWFVTDAALLALYMAPVEAIKENIPHILPWTRHPEWWLRASAFDALLGLRRDTDPQAFRAQLPTLIDTMVNEYHTWPRDHMTKELANAMEDPGQAATLLVSGFADPLPQPRAASSGQQEREMIAAGFVRATRDSKVFPDVGKNLRSAEGAYNVRLAAQACALKSPSAMADLADAMKSNITYLSDEEIVSIVAAPNAQRCLSIERVSYNVVYAGLFPSLEAMAPEQKQRLIDTLYRDYRPEFAKRITAGMKPGEAVSAPLLDSLVDITKLKSSIPGWVPLGSPDPTARIWRYRAFHASRPEDTLDPTREATLVDAAMPAGMDGWYKPGFDDSSWNQGRAPFGVGTYECKGHSYTNNTAWNDGEFLVMRTTFDVTNLDYDYYRIAVLATKGYHIYLNGVGISDYGWWQHVPFYNQIMLAERQAQWLKKGTNTLAVYTMVGYDKAKEPVGQIDVFIEGLKKEGLGLDERGNATPSSPR